MALLIAMVNFYSGAYRQEQTIELLLQRKVYPCRNMALFQWTCLILCALSGITLTCTDANLALKSYFTAETMTADITDESGITRFKDAVTWVRMSAPTIARAARLPAPDVMHMERWQSMPSALLYQKQSTALNNTILLFTTEGILLSPKPIVRRF